MKMIVILDNIRSAHNVGSILRTADAAGVFAVICIGTTPHPALPGDSRPGHVASRNSREIAKTALGAELSMRISYEMDLKDCLKRLRSEGYQIVALEQTNASTDLFTTAVPSPLALVLGNEVDGVNLEALEPNDVALEIRMRGQKESLNVAVAAGIALYHLSHEKPRI